MVKRQVSRESARRSRQLASLLVLVLSVGCSTNAPEGVTPDPEFDARVTLRDALSAEVAELRQDLRALEDQRSEFLRELTLTDDTYVQLTRARELVASSMRAEDPRQVQRAQWAPFDGGAPLAGRWAYVKAASSRGFELELTSTTPDTCIVKSLGKGSTFDARDETRGKVEFIAPGSCRLRASHSGNNAFRPVSATLTLVITD